MTQPFTIDEVEGLVDSLYGSGDLSHDQANPILAILDLARGLQRSHHDAWVLIGRIDMALELVSVQGTRADHKRTARQLRAEIKKASGQ
jgi:hypothetical protein